MEAENILQEIAGQVAVCKDCQLNFSRKKAVPGEGPTHAQMMLIGEGPGFYENEQGRPFVGAAGKLLDDLLSKAGVSRQEVFITNVVKCRPPGNRDPQPEELLACSRYLDRQIETINPLIIVTLGRYSMAKFLPNVRISEAHGRPSWVNGRLIIPMFHPAAALHQPSLMDSVERDFSRLPEWIQQAKQNGHGGPARASAAPSPDAGRRPAVQPQAQQDSLLSQAPAADDAAAYDAGACDAGAYDAGAVEASGPDEEQKEEPGQQNDGQATQLSLF